MGIFQNSVLRNTKQDESILAHRWASFQDYLSKIEAIKDFKEEIYQDGFLHDVFEKCLGYTLKTTNPNNYSLDREQKNETDGKKADGAIYIDGKVVGVIELKDQKSKNLDVIEAQAFGYHASHANSRYIIISNFDELRFYIDKKSYYEKFNLFNLDFDEFRKLHLILSFESISSGLTNRLLEQSNRFEVDISKKLYSDFSDFRTHLFENIVKNNIDIDKQTLLRLTQKLCDRLIFILFAEDRGLLRPNTIKEIRGEFANQKFTSYSLYDIYKFYFDAISSGNDRLDIQKYNGGLFAKDELLDSLKIDDEQIDLKAQKLSDYDFMSDIGVNILGHIFEQSLSDIEELNASINDTEFDRKKSKRKKDGVFYTPEYITRYIVENTLGKLCTDKKAELNIIQIEPPKDSRKPTKKEQATKENLEIYRNWLLELKILDPACGSGAFLNQALEFLIREHKSLQQDLVIMGDITAFYDIEEGILEHNLYGVDINEDAVEIAKLSLWLRTAQKGRMLTNLSGKIKCGNSLIDDKSVAQNAFVWEDEFLEVFNQKIFLDTNIVIHGLNGDDTTGSKKFLELAKDNNLNCWVSSRTWWEVKDNEENKEKLNFLATVNTGGSNCVFGLSEFGQDFLVTEEHVILNQQIKEIINRSKSSIDCDILQSAVNNGAKYFITHNTKDFIKKDGTRERLEKLANVRIFTPEEFLEYFAKGSFAKGFDVIIGNPPYVNIANMLTWQRTYFQNNYITCKNKSDLYAFFVEKSTYLLKLNGKISFIMPHTWTSTISFEPLRRLMFETYEINAFVNLGHGIFQDAVVQTIVFVATKNSEFDGIPIYNESLNLLNHIPKDVIINDNELTININWSQKKQNIEDKLFTNSSKLESAIKFTRGIKTSDDNRFLFDSKINDEYKKVIRGKNIKAYKIDYDNEYIWYRPDLMREKIGCLPHTKELFEVPEKLITQRVNSSGELLVAYDNEQYYSLDTTNVSIYNPESHVALKYLLVILNSKLINWWFNDKFKMPTISGYELKQIPIKIVIKENQEPFIQKAELMLELNKKLQAAKQNFLSELKVDKLTKKLENFDELSFDDFVNEYAKAKKIKFADKLEERNFKNDWSALFENDKKAVLELKAEIAKTDKEIDAMVYALYGLSEDEIKVVEGSCGNN